MKVRGSKMEVLFLIVLIIALIFSILESAMSGASIKDTQTEIKFNFNYKSTLDPNDIDNIEYSPGTIS